ncbi:stage II sporulation protein M [Haladaptatus sp. DYF46]|uniref:stage II sporulation protein M n=1 Tax=Haladaptatus sp. DYF46 TaxID=2886041 RepID=UPI001E5DEC19|nr:stage II sporulation protein M [Haladaptatus sp. DYF46]
MKFSDASSSVRAVLLGRPASVLPLFLAGASINLMAQTFPIVGLVLAFLLLAGTGRLDAVFAAFRRTDLNGIETNPAAVERLRDAVMGVFTPEVIVLLVASFLCSLVVVFVARALVGAAQVHAVTAALRNASAGASDEYDVATVPVPTALRTERAVAAGVAGTKRDGIAFVLLSLARIVAVLLVFVAFGVVEAAVLSAGTIVSILGSFLLAVALFFALFVVYLLFLFVPQAIVVDGVGVHGGLRRSGGFIRGHKARVAGYIVVVVASFGVFSVVAAGLSFLGVSRVAAVILFFGLLPVLGVLKTALYLDSEPTVPHGRGSVRGAFGRGIRELRTFLGRKPLLVLAALSLFVVGGLGGWAAVRPFTLESVRPDLTSNVFGAFPLDVFVKLAANNWFVAISAAFAGLGFGVPTLVALLFNGVVVGAVIGLLPDPTFALALILPHGIIEIPGLSVAGALGLHLGGVSWSYVRGRSSADAFATELVRAYYVLLGLLPVFIVAAFIEAFVTWWVASAVV